MNEQDFVYEVRGEGFRLAPLVFWGEIPEYQPGSARIPREIRPRVNRRQTVTIMVHSQRSSETAVYRRRRKAHAGFCWDEKSAQAETERGR